MSTTEKSTDAGTGLGQVQPREGQLYRMRWLVVPFLLIAGIYVGYKGERKAPSWTLLEDAVRAWRTDASTNSGLVLLRAIRTWETNPPVCARLWNCLGLLYHRHGLYALADQAYRTAIAIDETIIEPHFNRGVLHLEHGSLQEAVRELHAFTVYRPTVAEGWYRYGEALLRTNRLIEAQQAFARAAKLAKDRRLLAEALNGFAVCLAVQGQLEGARQFLDLALQQDPRYPSALWNKAVIELRLGNNRIGAMTNLQAYAEVVIDPFERDHAQELIRSLAVRLQPGTEPSGGGLGGLTNLFVRIGSVEAVEGSSKQTSATAQLPPAQIDAMASQTNSMPIGLGGATQEVAMAHGTVASQLIDASVKGKEGEGVTQPPQQLSTVAGLGEGGVTTKPSALEQEEPKPPGTEARQPPQLASSASEQSAQQVEVSPLEQASAPLTSTAEPVIATNQEPIEVVRIDEEPIQTNITEPVILAEQAQAPPTAQGQAQALGQLVQSVTEKSEITTARLEVSQSRTTSETAELPERLAGEVRQRQKESWIARLNPLRLFRSEQPRPPMRGRTAEVEQPAAGSQATQPQASSQSKFWPRYRYRNPPVPIAGNRSQAEGFFRQALAAHQRRHFDEAIRLYRQAVEVDPAFFEASYNLALALYESGQLGSALAEYERALVIEPGNVDARYNFALALDQAGYAVDAVEQLEMLLRQDPDYANAHLLLGFICAQQLGNLRKAAAHYERLLRLNPQHPQAPAIREWLAFHRTAGLIP